MNGATNLDYMHLAAELACLGILLRRAVLRWQRAGQDPADTFRGLYVADEEALALLQRPLTANWGAVAALPIEDEATLQAAEQSARDRVAEIEQQAQRNGATLRLHHLQTAFEIDRFGLDLLLICLSPTLDLRYEKIFGYLQDDVSRRSPSVNLVLDLLCEPGAQRLERLAEFSKDAPLFKYQFLQLAADNHSSGQPLLRQTLKVDDVLITWFSGRYQAPSDLAPYVTMRSPGRSKTDWLLAGIDDLEAGLARLEARDQSKRPIIVFHGPDRLRQNAAARLVADHVRRPLLAVDLAGVLRVSGGERLELDTLRVLLRDARLTSAIPYLTGWDRCLADGKPRPELLQELLAFPDLILVAGQVFWQPQDVVRRRNLNYMEFPLPSYEQRQRLWECYLEGEGGDALDVVNLAGQFQLTTGQIRDAVGSARDIAVQHGRELQSDDLFSAARAHSNPKLATLARKISPRYSWDDIVLPEDQILMLREMVSTVRQRAKVLDVWGVGRKLVASRGVTALFSGPPGTGKTMAAEVIAGELGLDLYKIDLSTVISKYIGETEKNLERIFDEAASSNSILFFDEADALFGKRSEVRDSHDRYANIEISYLLQRMEAYDGVTMLATNLRANLDEAFTRRLQFAVDFPFPEENYRLRIWHTLYPQDVPRATDLDFDLLANRFRLAGGNIRNILVSAAYLAADDGQCVTMEHLLHGTRRELQKMGRLIGEDDLLAD